MSSFPEIHRDWVISQIGQGALDLLTELKNDTAAGRINRKSKKEISKHYREEFKRMEREGSMDLVSW